MTDRPELNRVSAPSQFHLAFALALVKNKPPDKDLKDYIMELRRHVNDEMQVASPERFFDSVAFWQNAYQQSEAEQAKLHNTIFELQQRIQSFNSKIKDNRMSDGSPLSKRKIRFSEDETGQGSSAKKAQAPTAETKTSDKQEGTGWSDSDDESETSSYLLRQIHTVQTALKKKKVPNYLVKEAVILCKIAESDVIKAILQSTQPASKLQTYLDQQTEGKSVSSIIKAVQLAFNLTHQSLHRIIGSPEENQGRGQLIYYLVCLFQSTMTALAQNCTAASAEANEKENPPQETPNSDKVPLRYRRSKPAKAKAKAKAPLTSKTSNANIINEVAQQLTNTLCSMARSLDLKQTPDQEIMQGILFIAIERVGKILALLTFNNRNKPSDGILGRNPPQGLTAMKEESMTPEMVQLEAKYLIIFLQQILGHAFTETDATQPEFLRNSKLRFQKTLLQAVFGKEDPLFKRGLGRPQTPPALSSKGGQLSQGFSEWFTGELWRLIGWDILGSATQT